MTNETDVLRMLELPASADGFGEFSDGYHTFNELYEHRHWLFLALMKSQRGASWASQIHADGSYLSGWFIAGMDFGELQITYHLPDDLWVDVKGLGIRILDQAPPWDGHTSDDVVHRLKAWVLCGA